LAQMWTAIHFGDYTAFHLAMTYGVDPWDTSMLEQFKKALKAAK
jgi:Bacterial phospho-glucose isomerase C-terminal SIS domain